MSNQIKIDKFKLKQIVDYILSFLLRDYNSIKFVGYCSDKNEWNKYKLVIVPSNFFDDNNYGLLKSMPSLPLKEMKGMPILYGDPFVENIGDTIVCHADFIASTYFLISRYQEFLFPNKYRDEHGRFIGKESIPFKANFIDRPIIEEYGNFLKNLLNEIGIKTNKIPNIYNKVYLTHDVDILTNFRRPRGFLGGIYRSIKQKESFQNVIRAIFDINKDPAYTFPWIYEQDNKIKSSTKIYFIKAANPIIGYDYPGYNLLGKDFKYFINETINCDKNTIFGLHASYRSGNIPQIILSEKNRLKNALSNQNINFIRYHYLHSINPTDMQYLVESKLTDDFTMGYADVAGFRLGTCRSVKYINPANLELTDLILHPLTVMDCTLSEKKYMNLDFDEAFKYVENLINSTIKYNGDITLLWHNSTFQYDNYHKEIYVKIIEKICH